MNRASPFLGRKPSQDRQYESMINKGPLSIYPAAPQDINSVKVRVLKDCIVTPEAVEAPTRIMLVSGGPVQEIVGFSGVARQLARVLAK